MQEEIIQQMNQLKLSGMNRMWQSLLENRKHHELSLSEGLEILLQAEMEERNHRRLERLKKAAGFRYQASIEEVTTDEGRGLERAKLLAVSDCSFIKRGDAILITGPTGAGKSFLASAIGHQACGQGFKTLYFNIRKLLRKLQICRAEGSIIKFMDKLTRQHLLILDDFGLSHLDHSQSQDLLEIIEDRHNNKATIIVSQLPIQQWHDLIEEKTVADAIMDRLVHQAYKFELKGESLRKNL